MGAGWAATGRGRTTTLLNANGQNAAGLRAGVWLCHLEDLPDPGSRACDPFGDGRSSMFLVRQGSRVYAYRDVCPHQGAHMAWRRDAYLNRAGNRIVCNAHGAQFKIESGECLLGPCLGAALTPVAISIGTGGDIYLLEDQT